MKILLVDDETMSREAMASFLTRALGHDVTECENGEEALKIYRENHFPVVLTDIRMPKMDGLQLLREIRKLPESISTAVILITGFADVDSAVSALREGAFDYLEKPVEAATLSAVLTRLSTEVDQRELHLQTSDSKTSGSKKSTIPQTVDYTKYFQVPGYGMIGVFSKEMQNVIDMALRLHDEPTVPVLIQGETGTGKEVIAQIVHNGRSKNDAPFIALNCSAIAPGLFESELFGYDPGSFTGAKKGGSIGKLELAQKGTLFLDEISDMPIDMQPKLLRVLQEREMFRVGSPKKVSLNIRIIAATNSDLSKLVKEGKFRRDLYYRLNLGNINIPPLRNRKDDIIPLAQMFLIKFAKEKRRKFRFISPEAQAVMLNYNWMGNVRELQNAIERVVLLFNDEFIQPQHISFLAHDAENINDVFQQDVGTAGFSLPPHGLNIKNLEEDIIKAALKKFKGNKSEAARFLGLSRGAFYRRVEKYDQD